MKRLLTWRSFFVAIIFALIALGVLFAFDIGTRYIYWVVDRGW